MAVRPLISPSGPTSMKVSGAGTTVKVQLAGVGSALRARSTARTRKKWWPGARPSMRAGFSHSSNSSPVHRALEDGGRVVGGEGEGDRGGAVRGALRVDPGGHGGRPEGDRRSRAAWPRRPSRRRTPARPRPRRTCSRRPRPGPRTRAGRAAGRCRSWARCRARTPSRRASTRTEGRCPRRRRRRWRSGSRRRRSGPTRSGPAARCRRSPRTTRPGAGRRCRRRRGRGRGARARRGSGR